MAIDALTEEVAENLEEAAAATRAIDTGAVKYFLGGVAFGAVIGFYFGYRFNREKIRAEAFKQSDEEIQKIRDLYHQKTVAATPKPSVEEVIEKRGYVRPLKPPVPLNEHPLMRRAQDEGWDYEIELANREEDVPYVIHQDEFNEEEPAGYNSVTYTYYAGDDVLCDEDGKPLPHADIIVGQENLKFGHGADDEDVVFVRNDRLELEMEICRVPGSYEEEVLGLQNETQED